MESDKLMQELANWKLPEPARKIKGGRLNKFDDLVRLIETIVVVSTNETKTDEREVKGLYYSGKKQMEFRCNARHNGSFWLWDSYEVVEYQLSEHNPGSGGKNNSCTFLTRNGKPLIGSVHENWYGTFADFDDDYSLGDSQELYVYEHNDELAKKLGEKLGV